MIPRRPALLLASLLPAALLLAPPAGAAPSPSVQGSIEELTIIGERPGPGLWKATRDGHVLWLLGTLDPLPSRMTWRSAQVERVLGHAQLLLPGSTKVKADAGPIALVGLYLRVRKAERLPDGLGLSQVMPPALHQRLEALRLRFAPGEPLENLRPVVAAQRLYEKALASSGLRSDREVERTVLHLARGKDVPVADDVLRIEDPKGLLAELEHIPVEAELGCLEVTIGRLEHDLPAMRERAAAWAVGDVEALRRLRSAEGRGACWEAAALSPRLHALIEAQAARRVQRLDAARVEHAQSLALLPIDRLLDPEGPLATLRAMGYSVEEPR